MSKLALFGGSKAVNRPLPPWPVHDEQDAEGLMQVLRSGKWWLYAYGGGPRPDGTMSDDVSQVERFEREFAAAHFVKHCHAVTSGTCALEIALKAMSVGPGAEVITTGYTFIASSSAILSRCALPVYVDIDADTYNIDPARIEEAITSRTRAIEVVHLGGEICDMDAILGIARRHGLAVIEDAAQATGSILEGNRAAGGIGDVGTYSFQASKVVTAGEGGACATQDDPIAELIWSYRNCGRSKTGVWYEHHRFGHNNRLSEFQGVILRGQLRRLTEQCRTREHNYRLFLRKLAGIPGITGRKLRPDSVQRCLSVIILTFTGEGWDGIHRDAVLEALQAEGVPATLGYGWANYRNPAFLEMPQRLGREAFAFGVDRFPDWQRYVERCPATERACSHRAIFMPHALMLGSEADIQMLADAFAKVYECRSELARLDG
ncbi:MAG: DegT/DnrJ/EryC1/StrS family aminotransferase [Planctomycetes bacterium]|nr:DegT/DnrJ/EryC1/StrS family aminotransferase [Planctomycetota bacterium]